VSRLGELATGGGRRGLFCALWLAVAGCAGKSTPEAACEQLLHAVAEGDASAVFDSLLQTTQWSFYSVAKNHRKMRDLIKDSYPAAQQGVALGRLYGADAGSGRDLFVRLYPERYEKDFTARLGPGAMQVAAAPSEPAGPAGPARPAGPAGAPRRLCSRGGPPFMLQATTAGRWGMAELDREWDEAQLRAYHDLATVQKNAELYRGVQPAPK